MKRNRFLNGVSMKVCAVLPLLVLLSCASAGGGNSGTKTPSVAPVAAPVVIAEEPTSGISLDEAIEQSVREFKEKTAPPKRVAIVQFDTEAEALSEYIMEEITATLVNFDFEVAERKNLDFVRKELDLQYSGEADDKAMVSIGRFIGAESVLVGELLKVGSMYRYRLNSINVERAVREAAIRLDVRNDRDFNVILESLRSQKPEDVQTAAQPAAPPIARAEAKPEAPAAAKPVPQPETAGAFLDRGILFAARGDFALAIEDFSEAVKLNPDFAAAYNNRGFAYYNKKDYDRAIADYTQAIRLDPDDADVYNNRGNAYKNKGDYDRAIADYNQALRIDPDYANAYYNRGLAYYNKKDYDRAIADCNQALRIDADYTNAYVNRGNAYLAKNDYNRAIADYNQALRIAPNNAFVYNNRGSAYWRKGYKARARADWRKVLKIDPNNESARDNLALP